jgi:hypothetical protein
MTDTVAPSALDALWQMLNQHRLPLALLVAGSSWMRRSRPAAAGIVMAGVLPAGPGVGIVEGLPLAGAGEDQAVTHTPRRSPPHENACDMLVG